MGDLTSEQAAAITYAYLDISHCDVILNHEETCQHRIMEVGEAVAQTKSDLEKAFPFLLLGPNDERIIEDMDMYGVYTWPINPPLPSATEG